MATFYSNSYRNFKSYHVYLLCLGLFLFCSLTTALFSEESEEVAELADTTAPQTKFFFGDGQNYDQTSSKILDEAFNNNDESSGHEEEDHSGADKWIEEDISPLFPELKILDELGTKKSLQRMKKARRYYSQAKHSIQIASSNAELENKKLNLDGVRYKWEKNDRKEEVARRIKRVQTRGRLDAVSYLIRGIRELDQVKNPVILKSKTYLDLKANLYREYVKQQFKNRNLHLCVDILQQYLELSNEHKKEPEVHKLLAACYRHQEILAKRARDNKTSWNFKALKNDHLVKYAFLAYGEDSAQYIYIKQKIDSDRMTIPLKRSN